MKNQIVKLKATEEKDGDILSFKKAVPKLEAEVDAITIKDEATNASATEYIKNIKSLYKKIEDKRKARTSPLDEAKKLIMDDYRPLTYALLKAEKDIKNKMGDYIRLVEAQNRKIREQNEKKIEAQNEKMLSGKITAPAKIKEEIEIGATGQSSREILRWRLVDLSKIPAEFLTIDEKKIDGAVKLGINIPGVEVYKDISVIIR